MPTKKKYLVERFWEKVEIGSPDECWLWKGSLISTGYGEMVIHDRFDRGRQKVSAHRLSLMFSGVDCEGLVVHHSCHQKLCMNPAHLRIMSNDDHLDEHRVWTEESVMDAILRFVDEHGVFPAAADWNPNIAERLGHQDRVRRYREGHFPHTWTVQRIYGSWSKALRAAGYRHNEMGRRGKEFEIPRHAV